MKELAVFENVICRKRLERKFFAFCRRWQPSLLRFVPAYIAADFLYLFRPGGREKYLRKRWSFLKQVKRLDDKLSRYFKKQKIFLPSQEIEVVSDQPERVLSVFCEAYGLKLHANAYDMETCSFENFRTERELAAGEEPYTAYGTLRAPIMKDAARKIYVYGKWMTADRRRYIKEIAVHAVLTYAAMFVYAVALGYVSLHYAAGGAENPAELLSSYRSSPAVLLLNIAPVVLLMFLLYYLCNSAAVAALGTSALTLVLTWINYFKLIFRGDPFVFEDVLLAKEATAMTNNYKIVLSRSMILVIAAAVLAVAVFAFYLHYRPHKPRFRLAMVLVLLLTAAVGYKTLYLSETVYEKTYREVSFLNYWSESHQFQNRGFLYPFLRSTSKGLDHAPESYNEKQAKTVLAQYEYTDIPEEKKVHVIACMLEAYSDFTRFDELQFTEDPYAFLHELQQESYSGNTLSYAFGGGTNIPERQFLTGLTQLPNFRKATNSYVWYFREQGYTVEGSHPFYHWFYNRSNVNQELGFQNYYFDEDTYLELNDGEHMSPDSVLLPHVVELFEQAAGRGEKYFSFTVTYQGHGPYPASAEFDHPYIEDLGYTEETFNYLNNYFAIIDDVDDALRDMVSSLQDSSEPVVLILFGDHMPWMGNNESAYTELGINFDLETDEGFYNFYATPYIIWANDAAKQVLDNDFTGEGPDIGTNFLMNEFFRLAGYTGDEYMQYTSHVFEEFQSVHNTGICLSDGVLYRTLSEEQQQEVQEFLNVQYYWRKHFRRR